MEDSVSKTQAAFLELTGKHEKHRKQPPKIVQLSYKINCISDVSAVMCTFEIDLKVFAYWCDPLLVGRKKGELLDYDAEKELFEPDIIVTNERELTLVEKDNNTKIIDSKTGEVKRSIHYRGTVFMGSMDLKLFPFDCQNLQICFKPYKCPREDVLLHTKWDECTIDRSIMHEWHFLGHCVKHFFTDPETSTTNKSYSTLFVTVLVRRKYNWHINNVYLPTAAFLLLSWLVFFYAPDARAERVDISIATLLASISNKFVIGDHIPKIDYRTLLDFYLDFCFYMQLLTFVTTVIVYAFRDDIFWARTINHGVFAIEFVSAFIFHEWMYIRLLNHEENVQHWVEASQEVEEPASLPNSDPTALDSRTKEFEVFSPVFKARPKSRRFESLSKSLSNKRVSSLVKILSNILKKSTEHFDDGCLMTAVSSSDHFIHFGAAQISKKIFSSVHDNILELFAKVQVRGHQIEEVVSTIKVGSAQSKIRRWASNKLLTTGVEVTTSELELERDLAAKLIQAMFRRLLASRAKVNTQQDIAVRKIVSCYRFYRRRIGRSYSFDTLSPYAMSPRSTEASVITEPSAKHCLDFDSPRVISATLSADQKADSAARTLQRTLRRKVAAKKRKLEIIRQKAAARTISRSYSKTRRFLKS